MRTQSANSNWTAREIKLLGTRSDAEVARLIGRTVEGVSLKRQKLRIAAPQQAGWTEDEIKPLGRLPDPEVARLLKRSVGAVRARRPLKGIAYQNPASRRWTAKELALPGRLPDDEVVARTGRPRKTVQIQRQELGILVRPHPAAWTPAEDRRLSCAVAGLLSGTLLSGLVLMIAGLFQRV